MKSIHHAFTEQDGSGSIKRESLLWHLRLLQKIEILFLDNKFTYLRPEQINDMNENDETLIGGLKNL